MRRSWVRFPPSAPAFVKMTQTPSRPRARHTIREKRKERLLGLTAKILGCLALVLMVAAVFRVAMAKLWEIPQTTVTVEEAAPPPPRVEPTPPAKVQPPASAPVIEAEASPAPVAVPRAIPVAPPVINRTESSSLDSGDARAAYASISKLEKVLPFTQRVCFSGAELNSKTKMAGVSAVEGRRWLILPQTRS